jgi:hypothetical protein
MYFSDGSAAQYKNRKELSTCTMNKILVSLLMVLLLNKPWDVTKQIEREEQ